MKCKFLDEKAAGADKCGWCRIATETCIHSRRCFVTGEYCSKQTNIQKQRKMLHDENTITAFVVMNFSNMSDVVYKWRLHSFIESLSKYLYLDKKKEHLYCSTKERVESFHNLERIKEIRVVRADSDTASNYVICSRICQQMQIADLIIVDVSSQNANVFYEFGMAVALGKLILPICYSESFYKMDQAKADLIERIRTDVKWKKDSIERIRTDAERKEGKSFRLEGYHLECYPWRKRLFEYYGIRYKKKKGSHARYYTLDEIEQLNKMIKMEYGDEKEVNFSDMKYRRFPYDVELKAKSAEAGKPGEKGSVAGVPEGQTEGTPAKGLEEKEGEHGGTDQGAEANQETETKKGNEEKKREETKQGNKGNKIGDRVYQLLSDEYNEADAEDNTLVVYTMDGFLNGEQAGLCIANFYKWITARMRQEQCFCGERVGVLVQDNEIPESEKDAVEQLNLFYSVGEIIQIGLNQATYMATEERIKTKDVLRTPGILETEDARHWQEQQERQEDRSAFENQLDRIKSLIKGHVRNRGLLIYPDDPVYVSRVTNGLQENLLDSAGKEPDQPCSCCRKDGFCLYHVMLKTLRYTNEIVVDITDNNFQSLFWLGAAHGSDVYAITVVHEQTDKERKIITGSEEKKSRNIFDVAGLWAAVLHSYDTEGFYQQLELVQQGIEYHSKLKADNSQFYEKKIREYLYSPCGENTAAEIEKRLKEKEEEEALVLESYYRKHFWNPILRYNQLNIYLRQQNDLDDKREPRVHNSNWDFDAVSRLSHYLSKRTVIGEYRIQSLSKSERDEHADTRNFICVGADIKPLGQSLPSYIFQQINKGSGRGDDKECEEAALTQEERYGAHVNVVHEHVVPEEGKPSGGKGNRASGEESKAEGGHSYVCEKRIYKGFVNLKEKPEELTDLAAIEEYGRENPQRAVAGFYTHQPEAKCVNCSLRRKQGTGGCQEQKDQKTQEVQENQKVQEPQETQAGQPALQNRNTEVLYDYMEVARRLAESREQCGLYKRSTHAEIAQLVLWRENADKEHEHSFFRVALNGSSGPATLALSALFVDEMQKQDYTEKEEAPEEEVQKEGERRVQMAENTETEDGEDQNQGITGGKQLLCEIQEAVRAKFMEIFLKTLEDRLEEIPVIARPGKETVAGGKTGHGNDSGDAAAPMEGNQKKRYFSLVKHAAAYYLSTVLYRYFLPFLSEEDINRIYNGMYTYVHLMKAGNASPFALDYASRGDSRYDTVASNQSVEAVIQCISETLLYVLRAFRGLEAFYQVTVQHYFEENAGETHGPRDDSEQEDGETHDQRDDSGQDTRKLCRIELMRDSGNVPEINYFFCFQADDGDRAHPNETV